jgi:hypothetical protein
MLAVLGRKPQQQHRKQKRKSCARGCPRQQVMLVLPVDAPSSTPLGIVWQCVHHLSMCSTRFHVRDFGGTSSMQYQGMTGVQPPSQPAHVARGFHCTCKWRCSSRVAHDTPGWQMHQSCSLLAAEQPAPARPRLPASCSPCQARNDSPHVPVMRVRSTLLPLLHSPTSFGGAFSCSWGCGGGRHRCL